LEVDHLYEAVWDRLTVGGRRIPTLDGIQGFDERLATILGTAGGRQIGEALVKTSDCHMLGTAATQEELRHSQSLEDQLLALLGHTPRWPDVQVRVRSGRVRSILASARSKFGLGVAR
jgi:hypothetical protein